MTLAMITLLVPGRHFAADRRYAKFHKTVLLM
jgi:hypothetical protein